MANAENEGDISYYKGFFIDPAPTEHYDPPEKGWPWSVRVWIGRDQGGPVERVSFTLGDAFARTWEEAARLSIDLGKTIIDGLVLAERTDTDSRTATFADYQEDPLQLPAHRININ